MSRPMIAARELSTTKPSTRPDRTTQPTEPEPAADAEPIADTKRADGAEDSPPDAAETNGADSTDPTDGAGPTKGTIVAPFVRAPSRLDRVITRRRWQRRGFVPLMPGKPKIHHRILPRTVIGISFMLLSCGIGAAFSGAAFYAYYDNRLAENEETVSRFVDSFDEQFSDAAATLDELRVGAVDDLRAELEPIADQVSDANGVINLPATAGPSVWLLETHDGAGRPVSGAAFAVAPHEKGTAFVTSFSLVEASTVSPGPELELIKGDHRAPAELWAWDDELDLAVLVIPDTVEPLKLADDEEQVAAVGARVFALSGVGGQGATAAPGVLLDHSNNGLQHSAPIGTLFRGGPLLTGDGQVVGVATIDYQPHGIDQGTILQAPDITALCTSILDCPDNIED